MFDMTPFVWRTFSIWNFYRLF